MPAPVKEMAAGVTEMKETFTDPLGQKKEKEKAEAEAADDAPSAEPAPLPAAREMPVVAAPVPGRAARARGAGRSSDLRRFLSSGSGSSVGTFGPRESPPTEDSDCSRSPASPRSPLRSPPPGRHAAPSTATKRVNGKAALERDGGQLELGRLRRHRARLDGDHREPDDAVQERHRDLEAAEADLPGDAARPRRRRPVGRARRLQHEVDRARADGDVGRLRQREGDLLRLVRGRPRPVDHRQEPEDQPGRHDHGLGRRQRRPRCCSGSRTARGTRSSPSASPSRAPT